MLVIISFSHSKNLKHLFLFKKELIQGKGDNEEKNSLLLTKGKHNFPVFPGCEDAINKIQCFNLKISTFITDNFDKNLLRQIQERIKDISVQYNVMFIVNENGEITNIKINSSSKKILDEKINENIKHEIIRILSGLSQLEPAEENGKPVAVVLSLPVIFHPEG